MSLILDALNRSRTEAEPVPGLASEPVFLPDTEPKLTARLPWVALVAALLLIGWLLYERFHAPATIAPQAAAVKQAEPVTVEQIAKPVPAPIPAKTNAQAPASQRRAAPEKQASAPRPASAPTTDKHAIDRLYAAPRPKVAAAPTASAERAVKTAAKTKPKPRPKPAARPKPALSVDEMVQAVENERKNVALEEHPAPFISALSQPKKDAIPTLLYERHDYDSAAAGRSSVTINGKTVRIGGNAARGVKVEEILRDSVVLVHQGTPFRLRALNSWVNL